jgi:two-component system nitrogen regulation sensor histidine kinase NtrY
VPWPRRRPRRIPISTASTVILVVLGFNLADPASATVVGLVLDLIDARASDAGARLHLRFVSLFSVAAVAPAVIVALFFGVLVNRGVDGWFSERVQTVVENSATVARSYVEQQTTTSASTSARWPAPEPAPRRPWPIRRWPSGISWPT